MCMLIHRLLIYVVMIVYKYDQQVIYMPSYIHILYTQICTLLNHILINVHTIA